MTEKLTLAEAYYMVASDLQRNAMEQLSIAERLNNIADNLCEQNMREASPKEEERSNDK